MNLWRLIGNLRELSDPVACFHSLEAGLLFNGSPASTQWKQSKNFPKSLHKSLIFSNFVSAMSNYREYGRTELALRYNPELSSKAAWKKLKHWIDVCQPLKEELLQLGYTGRQRTFTPRQVNRIVHYLGEF